VERWVSQVRVDEQHLPMVWSLNVSARLVVGDFPSPAIALATMTTLTPRSSGRNEACSPACVLLPVTSRACELVTSFSATGDQALKSAIGPEPCGGAPGRSTGGGSSGRRGRAASAAGEEASPGGSQLPSLGANCQGATNTSGGGTGVGPRRPVVPAESAGLST
jgi:hypothetical protein